MKKEKSRKNNKYDVSELVWQNFIESGEIGDYLLYKRVEGKENERPDNARDSTKSD